MGREVPGHRRCGDRWLAGTGWPKDEGSHRAVPRHRAGAWGWRSVRPAGWAPWASPAAGGARRAGLRVWERHDGAASSARYRRAVCAARPAARAPPVRRGAARSSSRGEWMPEHPRPARCAGRMNRACRASAWGQGGSRLAWRQHPCPSPARTAPCQSPGVRPGLRWLRTPNGRTPPCHSASQEVLCFRVRALWQARRRGPWPLLSFRSGPRPGPVSCRLCSLPGTHRVVMSASPLSGSTTGACRTQTACLTCTLDTCACQDTSRHASFSKRSTGQDIATHLAAKAARETATTHCRVPTVRVRVDPRSPAGCSTERIGNQNTIVQHVADHRGRVVMTTTTHTGALRTGSAHRTRLATPGPVADAVEPRTPPPGTSAPRRNQLRPTVAQPRADCQPAVRDAVLV